MRKILGATAVVLAVIIGSGCTPTATLTATPSTTKPGCGEVTTVTGKLDPKNANREVTLETQRPSDGKWGAWEWFTDAKDGLGIIQAPVNKTTGSYSLTYLAPARPQPATVRLRIRTTYNHVDVVSKSWYVTHPAGC